MSEEVEFVIRVHGGGFRCEPPFTVTFTALIRDGEARTMSHATLAKLCCEHIGPNNLIHPGHITLVDVDIYGWEPLPGNEVLVDKQQQRLVMDAMAVPTAFGPGEGLCGCRPLDCSYVLQLRTRREAIAN